jgi:hypothetical protein
MSYTIEAVRYNFRTRFEARSYGVSFIQPEARSLLIPTHEVAVIGEGVGTRLRARSHYRRISIKHITSNPSNKPYDYQRLSAIGNIPDTIR